MTSSSVTETSCGVGTQSTLRNKAATVNGIYVNIKSGNVNKLVTILHFAGQWICLNSVMVVSRPMAKNVMYIKPSVSKSEPMHISISASVAKNPCDIMPTMIKVPFASREINVKSMPGAMVISRS